jgi:hypothetical protein
MRVEIVRAPKDAAIRRREKPTDAVDDGHLRLAFARNANDSANLKKGKTMKKLKTRNTMKG